MASSTRVTLPLDDPEFEVPPSSRFERVRARWVVALSRRPVLAALLVALIAASLLLHLEIIGQPFWMDEGISVGVASHAFTEIPGLLRADGSPPLYYLLLHGWMALFGDSELATDSFSLVAALAAVPVALWAGWSLFGRRTGWVFAAFVGFSPFLGYLAVETRMYALVALLALVATASFLHAFVFRRRRYLWLFAASLILVLYTHYWGLWLAAGALVALVPAAAAARDRGRLWRDALLSFGAVALAFLPWLPTLVFQRAHTGAPWAPTPVVRELVSVSAAVLGDTHERVLVALVLIGAPALWVLARGRGEMATAAITLAVLGAVPILLGWGMAQVSPSWAVRYLAVCAPAILLLGALALSIARLQGLIALAVVLLIWIQPVARLTGARDARATDNAAAVSVLAEEMAPVLGDGDLIVAMQMEEVPVLDYYLPDGLRYANAMGPVADPRIADWRDALARIQASSAPTALVPQLDAMAVGSSVVLICPLPGTGATTIPWFAIMKQRCQEWRATLEADTRFTRVSARTEGAPPEQPDAAGATVAEVLESEASSPGSSSTDAFSSDPLSGGASAAVATSTIELRPVLRFTKTGP